MNTVTFATKVWCGDYMEFLKDAFEKKKKAIGYDFTVTMLVLNNGIPPEAENKLLDKAEQVVHADPYLYNVYAAGEMAAVEKCTTQYLCYVQGDCKTTGGDWIQKAILILESEPEVMVVSPESDVNSWHDLEGYDHYFSDQAFLVRTKDFQNPDIYIEGEPDPDYPSYALNSFEAMVGRYLKKTGKKRKILNGFWTYHEAY